jgi:hypothetical protein
MSYVGDLVDVAKSRSQAIIRCGIEPEDRDIKWFEEERVRQLSNELRLSNRNVN